MSGAILAGKHPFEETVTSVAWSPEMNLLALGTTTGLISVHQLPHLVCVSSHKVHSAVVTDLQWASSGELLSTSGDGRSAVSNRQLTSTSYFAASGPLQSATWLAGSEAYAVGGSDGISLIQNNNIVTHFVESDKCLSVKLGPIGDLLASCHVDGSLRLWRPDEPSATHLPRPSDVPYIVTWHPTRPRLLAVGTHCGGIEIWDVDSMKLEASLETHSTPVTSLSFAPDGTLLAARSTDGRLSVWRTDFWTIDHLFQVDQTGSTGLAFPSPRDLIVPSGQMPVWLESWSLPPVPVAPSVAAPVSTHYANAKVVLVGDTGVGKSALAMVLSGFSYSNTDSTHGIHIWRFSAEQLLAKGIKETREIYLWDLAGQPTYRLTHQLHLDDVALALIVFDARSDRDPFAGVRFWNRALAKAEQVQHRHIPRILVSARADRGRLPVSRDRIEAACRELGAMSYVQTSAKEGWGLEVLSSSIAKAIHWEDQSKVASGELFDSVMSHVLRMQRAYADAFDKAPTLAPPHAAARAATHRTYQVLFTLSDLYDSYPKDSTHPDSEHLRREFEVCVTRLAARGVVRRFAFGNLVLLQPELVDAYASAIVQAAYDDPDGIGTLFEEDILSARFAIPKDVRLPDRNAEALLLIATLNDLLKNEIAFKEDTRILFPSGLTREWPGAPDPDGPLLSFSFEGNISFIYSSLVVRLTYGARFRRVDMWKNAVLFSMDGSQEVGLWLRELDDGKADLVVFAPGEPSSSELDAFEAYVENHLEHRTTKGSVLKRRFLRCGGCGTAIPPRDQDARRARGYDWLTCSVCDTRLSLVTRSGDFVPISPTVVEMENAATRALSRVIARSTMAGKIATQDYDMILFSTGVPRVVQTATGNELKDRGLNVLALDGENPSEWVNAISRRPLNPGMGIVIVGTDRSIPWTDPSFAILRARSSQYGCLLVALLLGRLSTRLDLPGTLVLDLENPSTFDSLEAMFAGSQRERASPGPSIVINHTVIHNVNGNAIVGSPALPGDRKDYPGEGAAELRSVIEDVLEHVKSNNDLAVHVIARLCALDERLASNTGATTIFNDDAKRMLSDLWLRQVSDDLKPTMLRVLQDHVPAALRTFVLDAIKLAAVSVTMS